MCCRSPRSVEDEHYHPLRLAAEWVLLHHVAESWFKIETAISDIRLRTSRDVGTRRS
jgi:hypothetical protein